MNASKTVLLVTIFGLGMGAGIIGSKYIGGDEPTSQQAQADAEKKPLYWQAPMDKSFRSDNPGKSPMGMELIPVYADANAAGDDRNLVRINPTVENNIGVRTAHVTVSGDQPIIETVGTIQIDDDNTSVVDVRSEGWVEKMPVKAVGDVVRKGQLLFQLYSRPLVSAQDEYIQAVKMGRENLISATSSRLLSLGMSTREISHLRKQGASIRLMNIYAPRSGIVTQMGAGEGAFVKPGMNVLKIVDLSTVWAIADVFEDQVHQVHPGQIVYMHMSGMPSKEWVGKVEYIYPTVNAKARTVQVRINFDNSDGLLRPDMFARLTIQTGSNMPDMKMVETVIIPREALIKTGRTERVILALGDGQYQPAQVVSGQEIGDNIEIISGLSLGEKIVVSSQFLLDSEASLRGTILRLTPNDNDKPDTSIAKEGTAMGSIISLMQEHGMVTVDHEAIPAIDMSAMIMGYVAPPEMLEGFEEGDSVSITVLAKPNEDGNYMISAIEKMDMAKESNKEMGQ
jgi:membrane fusion protein, copper/silver efflux system